MVGVGVAEGGGPGAPEYYGEYYQPEQYFVPPEMCPHPQQHPQHAHMCAVHAEYGGMPVVTSTAMMPPMMPGAVMDENMRHYLVHGPHAQHAPPHPHHAHHQQQHHQPPPPHHHQPTHHYNATNGAGGPQHYYGAGYPPHFHMPPHHLPHYQPPPLYQKDERTQRQHTKLKQKYERRYNNRNNNGMELSPSSEVNSGASTPSLSPRKEQNGSGAASSGARSEGEGSSAGASLAGDDEPDPADTQALLDLLSATRKPQVSEMTSTTALVQWNSPLPEGVTLPRLDLTYELLLGDRGRYKAIYSGPKLSCWVCDLRPGCEYSVCLQIRAGEVTGAASEAATFRAPAAPPAPPAAPRLAARSRSSLALRWPAAADNGARVLHYLLEVDAGEGWREVAKPRSRQHSVNDLRPQTRHRFRLAAVNECGRGEWSEELVAWTAGAPPPAPPPPRLADAARDSLALAWERRAPEEEYTLQAEERAHGFLPVYSGPDTAYRCTGLHRATDYRFRLRCENADGQGPWSADVTYRTLPARPAPPGRPALRGKPHARSLRLRWEPPADDGGAPVHTYTLELDDGAGYRAAYSGPDREATCDRLRPGTAYRARVNAANEAGLSEWSAAESVATEAAAPGPCEPPAPAAPPRPHHAAVRWRAPECTGGADLTEYRVEVAEEGGAPRLAHAGPLAECTLRDLRPGQAYLVTVSACNRVGTGPPSAPLSFTTPAAPPDAPAAPHVTLESPRAARVSWDPPADNGAPLLDYRLEMSAADADAFSEVYRGLATERLLSDLTPFTAYFFRVCASNAAGRGAWSAVRDALTPLAPPAAPPPPRYEAEACALRVRWRAPACHGAPVLRYRVRVDDAELQTEGTETERLVEGLEPDTAYRVRVAAENELGLGAWSEPVRANTRPPPPAPPALAIVQRAHNHLKLKWGENGGGDETQYRVEMRAADSREWRPAYRGPARCCKVKKLREASVYAFRIRASDERGGCGEWSAPLEAETCAAPPGAPRALAIADAGPGRALLSWEGEGDSYAVQVCRAGGAWRAAWAGAGSSCVLEELEAGGEYLVRVCALRAGAAGAWSGAARLVAAAAARAPRAPRAPRPARRLAPRHAALLAAGGFLLLAVLVAAVLQRLVAPAV